MSNTGKQFQQMMDSTGRTEPSKNQENVEDLKKIENDLKPHTDEDAQVKQSQMTEDAPKNLEPGVADTKWNDNAPGNAVHSGIDRQYQDHELRVIEERDALAEKAIKLRVFIAESPIFKTLPDVVKSLRQAQLFHMEQYLGLLTEIIRLFSGGEAAPISKGNDLIGDFGTGNESVFILKYLAALYIDATDALGQDPRRNAVVATDMEKVQMMAVKSVFSKPKKG